MSHNEKALPTYEALEAESRLKRLFELLGEIDLARLQKLHEAEDRPEEAEIACHFALVADTVPPLRRQGQ